MPVPFASAGRKERIVDRLRTLGLACLVSLAIVPPALAQEGSSDGDDRSVEQVVRDVYDLVSWTDGNTPDWEVVREIFRTDLRISERSASIRSS